MITFVYYRGKTVPYLAHQNSLNERNADSASRGPVDDLSTYESPGLRLLEPTFQHIKQ